MEMVPTPKDFLEYLAGMRFSTAADARIQDLMDRNNEGLLSAEEREVLAALASLSQDMSIVRSRALQLLGRKPV
jgi:hypothetical protein